MKKHFYIYAFLATIALSGSLNPAYGQKYCKPTFSSGGCNGYDVTGISIGTFSSSPSCVSTGVDTSGLSGPGIVVYRGKTYSLTINGSAPESYAGYIDYQHDGSFEDVGDFVADDDNDQYSSITENITIPLSATPVVTRLRVMASFTPSLNYNTECSTYSNGSSQDYKITITAFPKDIGVLALTPAYCPNKKEPVQVIIQNIGLNTLNSIPFTFKVGSTTVSSTYSRTLASNTQDTFTIGTFDASSAGTYNLKIYSNLTGDGDRTNDTINASLHIAQPAAPTVNASTTHCGPGSVYLNAKSTTAKTSTYWFKTDTGVVIYKKNIDSIKTPFLPIGAADTFYAESRFATNTSLTKGNWSTARTNYGNMFDVFTKNIIIVDSFDVNFTGVGTSDSCGVFYKIGTYSGYENDKKAWTHAATVPVISKGGGNKTRVVLPRPITLQVGTTYGFYTVPISTVSTGTNYDTTYHTTNPLSNGDITITAGSALTAGGPFNGIPTASRDWDGTFYYHLNACPSARVPVSVTMLQNPNGAYLAKSTPFKGKYNLGDEVHADQICAGDTETYTIAPPTGMSQSDYSTKWVVNSVKIATVRGTLLPNSTVTMPTASSPGVIQIYPPATYGDTVFVISVDMKTPGSGCDSVIQRFVNVSSNPKADFSFTNPCGNVSVVINDLSNINSAIDTIKTYTWDFGDSSTKNLNRRDPFPHLYAHTGTYQVSLSILSTTGCPASVTKTLVEYPVPNAKFGTGLPCNDHITSFIDSSTISGTDKITNWAWDFGDKSASTTENPGHVYLKSGPYKVSLLVTSNNGCKDSLTKTLRVKPLPQPYPNTTSGVFSYVNRCVSVPIYMSTSNLDDSAGGPTATWNYGDGTGATAVGNHTYTKNGTYTITVIIKSGNGCIDTFSKPITPTPEPFPRITFVPQCVGKTVHFVDSSGSDLSSTYSWDFGDGGTAASQPTPSVDYIYSKTGTYKVKISITNGSGCTGADSSSITIPGYPKAGFTASSVCIGNTTSFKNTSTGVSAPGGAYVWNFGDTTALSNLTSPTHTYANVGTYSAKLYAVNQFGCADSDSLNVSVNPLPVIKAWKYGKTIDHYTVNFLPVDTTIGSFKWYFGDPGNDSSTVKKSKFTYTTDGKYQVKLVVTNTNGCTSERTDSVFTGKFNGIEVTGTIFDGITVFPNPFEGTTNINYTLPSRSNVNVSVYDAEGKLVATLKNGMYSAGSYTDAFDAKKYNASEGVYYLKMYVNDKYYTTKIINLK